jgi:hypothetical protein
VSHARPFARAGAVLAAAVLLASLSPVAAQARHTKRSESVTVTVDSITPATPPPSKKLEPLTFTLTLTNTTASDFTDVSLLAERGDPIDGPGAQAALDRSLAKPTPPATSTVTIAATHPVKVDLPAGQTVQVTFETTSGIPTGTGLCLCHEHAVYPLFFSAHAVMGGVDTILGVGSTYVPSFWNTTGRRLHVSWVWPLLERPHRLTGDTEFTDDLLATSLDTGRLSRALAVAEEVATQNGPAIPLTLLIDPELLDEVEVMADTTTPYMVQSAGGKPVPGTGQAAAKAWLDRLKTLLLGHPDVQVELTPYGDPDVQALAERGLGWSTTMPHATDMAARVADALGGRPPDSSLAWPAEGALSRTTLRTLARQGVSTVVLNASSVSFPGEGGEQPGLARLPGVGGSQVVAALTAPAVERYIAKAVTVDGQGGAALPALLAELAVRVAASPKADHAVVLTPPRYVDPNVGAAVQTIVETSRSTFAQPISLRDAVSGSLVPTGSARLARMSSPDAARPARTLDAAVYAAGKLAAIRSLLDASDTGAAAFVTGLPIAIQRAESSEWGEDGNSGAATAYAEQLTALVQGVLGGVHIVKPTSGSYTLASGNSPLPVTVENQLPYPVYVLIRVNPGFGVPGFATRDLGKQLIEPTQRHTFNIPTTTERSGRFRIQARLYTPSGEQLGNSIEMTVRSTALGFIGVVITIVAGAVLGLALLWRLARRLRGRRPSGPGVKPATEVAQPSDLPGTA